MAGNRALSLFHRDGAIQSSIFTSPTCSQYCLQRVKMFLTLSGSFSFNRGTLTEVCILVRLVGGCSIDPGIVVDFGGDGSLLSLRSRLASVGCSLAQAFKRLLPFLAVILLLHSFSKSDRHGVDCDYNSYYPDFYTSNKIVILFHPQMAAG